MKTKIALDDYDIRLIKNIYKICYPKSDFKKNEIDLEELFCLLDDLYFEYDSLEEEYEDFKEDVESNFRRIPLDSIDFYG